MHPGHIRGIADAAQRTDMTIMEELFCLLGLARQDSTYVVVAVVKPRQKTEILRFRNAAMLSSVFARPCPPGTIADLHTHPWRSKTPSAIDARNWTANRRFTLHLIAFAMDPERVGLVAHDYSDPNQPRGLAGNWLRPATEETNGQ